ncbi:unnamed protein product [Ilex paraguariensis]|uniref:Synaptonemal complex protein 1 n=1 Tax=Ilex paraguariensis TaxID=185542 RepID=A0ABC8SAL2_9AQUA
MNKLMGLQGLKSLDHFKSLSGSAKTISISSRVSSDSASFGSFANLKLTAAEKLVKEQASAKTDLDLANSKLKKLTEHVHVLEEKLQNAFNENAKLQVKQKEDGKLWKGLESKFSSTKTLCDQLTETLQHLAGQVQDAEKDKACFEDKLSGTSVALDNLHDQMKCLSLRLESSEETVRNREKELKELVIEKQEREKAFRDEQCRVTGIIEEKDCTIKNFEATVTANGLTMENMNSKLESLHLELKSKEDDLNHLRDFKENLENEKRDLLSSNQEFSNKVDMALCKIKNLEDFINVLAAKLIELDNQSLSFSEKVVQLNALYDSCFKMGQEERHIAAQSAQHKFDQLHDQTLRITSEKDAAQLVNQELNNKVIELQKQQEFAMVQHAEECRLTEERIHRLESEAETLLSKRTDMEILIPKLQEKIDTSIESSRLSEEKMQELLLKLSALENENKDNTENLQAEIQKKNEEIVVLQKEIRMHEQHVEALEKQVSQLGSTLEEKEQLVLQFKDKEKQLKDQKTEVQALLVDAESKLTEAKKQYDQMLESKQLELSRHLKEISQKNDQAINDIRRKYEVEKLESVNLEKEKADKVIGEMERKYDQKLAECKEESKQYLVRVQEEHAALLSCLQQENDKKESILIFDHSEELKRVQLQAENELREEDRQRALLQLQWKVMSDNAQEDQEVNSKKV